MINKIKLVLLSVTTSLLFVSVSFSNVADRLIDVDAYSYPSLPKSINLNDTEDDDIRSYYSELNSYDESEKRGTNLLKNLKGILRKNFQYYQYDDVWKIYEITDRDWVLSPASESTAGTYDSSTNYLSNYTYGTNVSTPTGDNPYVRALYRDQTSEKRVIHAWDGHSTSYGAQSRGNLNREHIWPKSYGFSKSDNDAEAYKKGPAGTDVHHLIAADDAVNQNLHGNYFYGNVDTTSQYTSGATTYATEANKKGKSVHSEVTATVFEPLDQDKGDIARAIFYMCAMYNSYDDSTPTVYDPNLAISSNPTDYNWQTISSTKDSPATYGILSDLLEWNKLDPVDDYEIHRNNLIYNNYQYNRNPFVDFPEWADLIWGDKNTTGNYANPATDSINNISEDFTISLDKTAINLSVGETTTINATCSQNVTWTVTDSDIISLSGSGNSQTITALKEGSTLITASYGTVSASCSVTINENLQLDKDSLSLYVGDEGTIEANKEVTWATSSSDIISLSSTSGTSLTIKGLSEGEAAVTATDGKTTLSCQIAVRKKSYSGSIENKDITLSPSSTFTSSSIPVGALSTITEEQFALADYKEDTSKLTFAISGAYRPTSANYWIFVKGKNPYIYNKDNLGKITSLSINFASGSSGSGQYKVSFSDSILSTPVTDSSSPATAGETVTINNDNDNYGYFQIAFSGANVRVASITINYSLYSSNVFAEEFLKTMNCDSTGVRKASLDNWNITKESFNNLNSAEQELLKSATANIEDIPLGKCTYQYDYIVNKYSFEDYMGRKSSNASSNSYLNNKKDLYLMIMVSVTLVGAIAISIYFYSCYKHKKVI